MNDSTQQAHEEIHRIALELIDHPIEMDPGEIQRQLGTVEARQASLRSMMRMGHLDVDGETRWAQGGPKLTLTMAAITYCFTKANRLSGCPHATNPEQVSVFVGAGPFVACPECYVRWATNPVVMAANEADQHCDICGSVGMLYPLTMALGRAQFVMHPGACCKEFFTYHEPQKPPRNSPCPCGSGSKFKKCCGS